MTTSKVLNDKWIRRIGIPLIALLLILCGDDAGKGMALNYFVLKITKNLFYVFIYWEINRMVFIYLRSRYPDPKDVARKLGIQLLIFIGFIGVVGLIIAFINLRLPHDDSPTYLQEYLETVEKSALILGLVNLSYECAYYFGRWESSTFESERLKKDGVIAQFELLKNQISPHFLFNSLNALIALIPEDPKLSVIFIQKLSNVYRHVLNTNDKDLVKLQAEMQFLKDYIFLLQMRFGENLLISYELPDDVSNLSVVPFTLQMLVENAVRHNIISHKKPLKISIRKEGETITVSNNIQTKTSGVSINTDGLTSIRERYQLLSHRLVEILVTAKEFTVILPLMMENELE